MGTAAASTQGEGVAEGRLKRMWLSRKAKGEIGEADGREAERDGGKGREGVYVCEQAKQVYKMKGRGREVGGREREKEKERKKERKKKRGAEGGRRW